MTDLRGQIETCAQYARKWKDISSSSSGLEEQKRAAERSYFWLELQAAFTFLWAVEQTQGKDSEVKKRLIVAKTNLTKKLADYADKIWKEARIG